VPYVYVIAPSGTSAAGTYAPATFVDPALPPALLADDIALNDPWVQDGDFASLLTYVHPVDAAVKEQFRLQRGTGAAVASDGNSLRNIRKINESTPREVEDEYRYLLKELVERGDIRIDKIVVEAGVDARDLAAGFVEYTNLRSGKAGRAP
jgi:hypothetical protein